jgi:hypothetical protein
MRGALLPGIEHHVLDADQPQLPIGPRLVEQDLRPPVVELGVRDQRNVDVVDAHPTLPGGDALIGGGVAGRLGL